MPYCQGCNAAIEWVKGQRGPVPVDAATFHGETHFNPEKHMNHFITCPDREKFHKSKRTVDADKIALTIVEEWKVTILGQPHPAVHQTALWFQIRIANEIKKLIE